MKGLIHIKRNGKFVTFEVDYEEKITILKILYNLNLKPDLKDINGNKEKPIMYDCGCHENVCGICSMVINGKPCLPCSVFFDEVGPDITIEPLSKFPLIEDLKVNRKAIEEHLISTELWLKDRDAIVGNVDLQYLSSSCLHCGCCLEACPNYNGHNKFYGAQWMNTCWEISSQIEDNKDLLKNFTKHGSSGCSKDKSCVKVCPQKINHTAIMALGNRARIKSIFTRR